MCLIVFSPDISKARISRPILQRAFEKNNDGIGFAYIINKQIEVSKPYFTFFGFLSAYKHIRTKVHKGPFLIHFRKGTCGPNNKTNTQPIVIYKNNLIMAHNGIFPQLSEIESKISDSVRLGHLIKKINWTFPFSNPQIDLLNVLCGKYSKLVFLNKLGRWIIINENLGKWKRGVWYSDEGKIFDLDNHFLQSACFSKKKSSRIPSFYNFIKLCPNISPGITYNHMTAEQKKEFDKYDTRIKKMYNQEKFRVFNEDPDLMEESEWQAWRNQNIY